MRAGVLASKLLTIFRQYTLEPYASKLDSYKLEFKFGGGEREQKVVYEISRTSLFYIYNVSGVFNLS